MDAANQCLDQGRMNALLAGDVEEHEQAAIAEHLISCRDCREKLAGLAGGDDMLADAVRSPDTADNASSADVQRLIDAIKLESQDATVVLDQTLPQDVSLDFLQPSERTDCLGAIGGYEILSVIGQGGMGTVLKAQDPSLNRIVAIKVLSPQLASNAVARQRFLREARSAAAVSHDHVVTIHAVDESAEVPLLVMEYISGISLADRIRRDGPLSLEKILRIGMQAASGLAAAHAQGLVHRDIKPSNILLENGVERVKITDFGLARALDDTQITQTGVVAGTPEYMSPEQAAGNTVDQRSDLFSLGCVLYAMCTGRSPFRASTVVAAIRRVCDDTPRPICEINSEIPDWLVQIVDSLLNKDPAQRFASAAELADLLGGHLAHLQQPSTTPRPAIPVRLAKPEEQRSNRRRALWTAAVASLLLLGAFGVSQLPWPASSRVNELSTGHGVSNNGLDRARSVAGIDEVEAVPAKSGTLEVTVQGGSAIELKIDGNGVTKRLTREENGAIDLAPDIYEVTLTNNLTDEVIRQGSLAIRPGERRRFNLFRHENSRSFPTRRRAEAAHFPCDGTVSAVDISDEGDRLLTATNKGTITLWTDLNGEWQSALVLGTDSAIMREAAFSPDGQVVATASREGVLGIWDAHTGEQHQLIEDAHEKGINHISYSSDGRFLASASDDGTVKLWNCETWEQQARIIAHSQAVTCVAFSPDGKTLATCSDDSTVRLWETASQKLIHRFPGHTGRVKCVAFSPDGKLLASAGWDTLVMLWNTETGKNVQRLSHERIIYSLVFSPIGNTLAVADQDVIRLWDWTNGTPIDEFQAHWSTTRTMDFPADGRTLVTGSEDFSAKLWQVANSEARPLPSRPQPTKTFFYWHAGYFASPISWSDDKVLALGQLNSDKVSIWDLDENRKIKELVPEYSFLYDVTYCPNGQLVTAGSRNGEPGISIWSSDGYQFEKHIRLPASPIGLAVAPDGRTLGVNKGWSGMSARLIDLESGETEHLIPTSCSGQECGVHSTLALSPDGRSLAVGTMLGFVTLWDTITGLHLTAPLHHGETNIWDVEFSPDGKTLVSASADSTIKFWDVADIASPTELGQVSHNEGVLDVAFSPDGLRLATVGGDADVDQPSKLLHVAEVRLWDVATQRLLVEFEGHTEAVFYTEFSLDGKALATSGRDCKVHLWDVDELLAYGAKTNEQ